MPVRIQNPQEFDIPLGLAIPDPGRAIPCVRQEQKNWCWAACIEMLLSQTGSKSQGEIVNSALSRSDCDGDGASPNCDRQLPISGPQPSVMTALVQNQLRGREISGPLEWPDLRQELDQSPVLAAFHAAGREGHIVLVVGYDPQDEKGMVMVNDPRSRPPHSAWKSHAELLRGLGLGMGLWSRTICEIG